MALVQAAQGDLEGLMGQRREELQDMSEVLRYVDDMRALLQHSSLAERKAFIRTFVKEVVVQSKEDAVLRYTLPLPPGSSLASDAEALALPKKVLASVRVGGPSGIRTLDTRIKSPVL